MTKTWILVANASQANIYEGNPKLEKSLDRIKSLAHPESRQKNTDLVADKGGNFSATGHGTMNQDTDPKTVEEAKFAKEIIQLLQSAHNSNKFDKLILIAGPHFLGLIRKPLASHLNGALDGVIEKDYTQTELSSIVQKIREDIYPFYA